MTDGRIFECFIQPQKINDKAVGRVFNFHDITERDKFEKELEYQARHDSLTGLPNRILLLDKIRAAIKKSEDNHSSFALMFLDLDRFKLINDSLSHAVGDELLNVTADRLQGIMREDDIVARLGGDEFVVVINNLTDKAQAIIKAKQVLDVFQEPFKILGREVNVTSSIGVSLYPEDGQSVDVLLRNADSAMYRAKELGGNNFQFYTKDMNAHTLEKLEKETEFHNAIANNELLLAYQPQYDIAQNKMVAVEALVRWNHPKKGILLPIDFIPLAEETGLIVSIGEWVLRKACQPGMAEVATSVLHNVGNVLNSVNVSAILIEEKIRKSKLSDFSELNRVISQHKNDLPHYLSNDPQGKMIPEYINQLAKYIVDKREFLMKETSLLLKNLAHVKNVINMQQNLSKKSKVMAEIAKLDRVVEEALTMTGIEENHPDIIVIKKYEFTDPIVIDTNKFLQILVNLLKNAKDSLGDSQQLAKKIKININHNDTRFFVHISDNGVGIEEDKVIKIFSYGFTTKKEGHGFGLHASALAAKELGGTLTVKSDGINKGATFTLDMPLVYPE